jgi:translation initiation factor 2 subunit 2
MNYEALLEEAYEKIIPIKESERFEILGVIGHHEGTKTVITNFFNIASSIRRPIAHLMKFLSGELASSAEISGDRLIFSRKVSSKEVNRKIEKYVNRFVLCPSCRKPDTELNNEGNKAFLKCLACGKKAEVHKI